jgi:hypothetical protein
MVVVRRKKERKRAKKWSKKQTEKYFFFTNSKLNNPLFYDCFFNFYSFPPFQLVLPINIMMVMVFSLVQTTYYQHSHLSIYKVNPLPLKHGLVGKVVQLPLHFSEVLVLVV